MPINVPTRKKESEKSINPLSYYSVEFDPNFAFKDDEGEEFFLYKDFLNVVNQVLQEQGKAPLSFDLTNNYVIDKTKDSPQLDHYNNIRNEVSNVMNSSKEWTNSVPSVRREQSVDRWTDMVYGVTREVMAQTGGLSLNKETKQLINEVTGEYINFLKPAWYGSAQAEHEEFSRAQSSGLKKGVFDFGATITRGIDINLPEFLGGGDTFWGDWSNKLRDLSDKSDISTGPYTMTTDELLESKEYGSAFWVMMNHALTSLPQQTPSAVSTIPALMGMTGPWGIAAMSLGLGAGYLQESGGFYEDIYSEYTQKRSRARALKGKMDPVEFRSRCGIHLDMSDTKAVLGSFKTLDNKFFDDEQLRMMSEQLAQEYGGWSTGLEVVNTIGDVALGRHAGILKKALSKNPKIAAKQWFKHNWARPYLQQMGTEGATEFGQEFVSEVKKEANVPEQDINWIQMVESGLIGSMYGGGFQAVSDVSSRIRNRNKPSLSIPGKQSKSFNKKTSELNQPTKYDNDIIVGYHGGGLNYIEDIINKWSPRPYEHDGVTETDLMYRVSELAETGALTRKNAKSVLKDNPDLLNSYSNWVDPFYRKPVEKVVGDTGSDESLNDPTGDEIYELDDLDEFDDPTTMDPSISSGLDGSDGYVELNIFQVQYDQILKTIKKLESEPDNPNQISRNEKKARIKELYLKLDELKPELDAESLQNKRHKDLINKGKETDELNIIGQRVKLRTKGQNGSVAKVISVSSKNPSLIKVKTSKGVYDVNIRNIEFSNPTQAISDYKKKTSNVSKRKEVQSDNLSRNHILKWFAQNKIELTPEQKKYSLADLKRLLAGKIPKGRKPGVSSPKTIVDKTSRIKKLEEKINFLTKTYLKKGANKKSATNAKRAIQGLKDELKNITGEPTKPKRLGDVDVITETKKLKELVDNGTVTDESSFKKWYNKKGRIDKLNKFYDRLLNEAKSDLKKITNTDPKLGTTKKSAREFYELNVKAREKAKKDSLKKIEAKEKSYLNILSKPKGMTFSSFDQPIEVGDLKNTTKATVKDIKKIRPNTETVLEAFEARENKGQSLEMFMINRPRIFMDYSLVKSKAGDILILDEDGLALGEMKADQTIGGLRTESLILGKGTDAVWVHNVVSVNNAGYQVAKYNIPSIESKATEFGAVVSSTKSKKKESSSIPSPVSANLNMNKRQSGFFANVSRKVNDEGDWEGGEGRIWKEVMGYVYNPKTGNKYIDGLSFFIYKAADGYWTIVEQETGMVADSGVTKKGAIARFENIVKENPEGAGKIIKDAITNRASKTMPTEVQYLADRNKKEIDKVFETPDEKSIYKGATESQKAEKAMETESVLEEPDLDIDLVDPFDPGTKSSEVKQISLDQIDKLISEKNKKPVSDEIVPEGDKPKIVSNLTGKALDSINNDEDISLDLKEEGNPKLRFQGNQRKKIDAFFETLWKQLKNTYGYTENNFSDFVNDFNDYFEGSPLTHNWNLWSETRMNSKGFKKTIKRFRDRAKRAVGNIWSDYSSLNVEYNEVLQEAMEYARENIGSMENVLGEESMSVKDFTKIAKTFFTRYNFIYGPVTMKNVYETAEELLDIDPSTAKDNLIAYLSEGDNAMKTLGGETLAEVLAMNSNARYLFNRFFNGLHTDNAGSSNQGTEGEIIEWEVIANSTSKVLEDEFTSDGNIKRNFRKFRATKKKGLDNNSRPEISTFRFYTRFIKDGVFSMLKGNDVYQSTGKSTWQKMYGFLDTAQLWNLYRDQFVKFGLVPIASRGEKARLILTSTTDKTINSVNNINEYILDQIDKWIPTKETDPDKWSYVVNYFSNILDIKNTTEEEQEFINYVFDGDYALYREHWIARHEALKSLFGSDYIFMDPQTIMKRIKIPFTPVATSDTLPDRNVMYFDSNGATISYEGSIPSKSEVYRGKQDSTRVVQLTEMIDGELQYIGDGTTLTSERIFAIEYPEHFGTDDNSKRAKTVQYNVDGDNVHMAKHQEWTLDLNENEIAVVRNKSGKEIAYFVKEDVVLPSGDTRSLVNIYDMNGNPIDHLMSDDEAKIRSGVYNKYDTIHTLPGKSIGMIQFTPRTQKNLSMFSTQLSYYFDDENFQNLIMNKFIGSDQNQFSPKNLIKKLIEYTSSGKAINNLIKEFKQKHFDVVPQNIEELGKLGVGRHPTGLPFLRDVLKKKVLKPLGDFMMNGSHLDFRADFRGRVSREETIIGSNNALIKTILERMGKQKHVYKDFEEKLADINEWLAEGNDVHTMVVRHPVASSVGFGIYRIKEIDATIGDSFIIHPAEVKERFEGDHDHDTGHLVWLDEEFYEDIKPYLRKTKGLNISKYVRQDSDRNISNTSGAMSMIRDMTYGETAIGEIVNVSRYAGVLNSMFGPDGFMKFSISGSEQIVKIRPLTMQVSDIDITLDDGTMFKGSLRELLRLYLQASVDHPKLLLLREWGYTQPKLLNYLFYDPKNPNRPLHEDVIRHIKKGLIDNVLRLNQEIGNQSDAVGKSISFKEIFEKSNEYSLFIKDREEYLIDLYKTTENPDTVESKDPTIQAGIQLLSQDESEIMFIGSKFKETDGRPTSLQELVSIMFDRALDISGIPRDRWFDVPHATSKAVHMKATRNIKESIIDFANEENNNEPFNWDNAMLYAQQLSDNLYELFESKRGDEADDTDLSFLSKMSSKTWDYSDAFINFYNEWSVKFSKLSKHEQTIATISFLNGVAHGTNSSQRLDLRMLPPIKQEGLTTLDSGVMEIYFAEYNELLDNIYKDPSLLEVYSEIKKSRMVNDQRKEFNCG